MGYKNSIDSATLVNKCLELVEAHYLFNIPFNKMKILIHPQAIVHSIIEFDNYVSHFNLFKNKIIKYTDIYKIIKKVTHLNLYSSVNTIKDILNYHEEVEKKLQNFTNYYT